MKRLMMVILASFTIGATANAKKLCEGIFPKNNLWIGVGLVDLGISQAVFDNVLDQLTTIYNPIVASHGYTLKFNHLWDDGTVNSDTSTEGGTWVINSYGGLARYSGMTSDGYAAVACHELGHHLGGAPLYQGDDMSVEGEADYHVGTKCLRKLFAHDDNVKVVSGMAVDPLVVTKCSVAFVGDNQQIALCERSAMAAFVVADILRDLGGDPKIGFNTPDPTQVRRTNEDHPAAQCRLDTYFESAVCNVSSDIEFSQTDYKVGSCLSGDGARSRCWFKPN
ncbi:MAG: hypothetical protein ACXVA9_02210 [Bdellovibrionales bacterium]